MKKTESSFNKLKTCRIKKKHLSLRVGLILSWSVQWTERQPDPEVTHMDLIKKQKGPPPPPNNVGVINWIILSAVVDLLGSTALRPFLCPSAPFERI